jgi:Ca2+/Na+ antiporter
MTKGSLIISLLSISAISISAFAPIKTSLPNKVSSLDAKKIHDNHDDISVGKIFAAAALSLAIFIGPSPAFADGEINDLIVYVFYLN